MLWNTKSMLTKYVIIFPKTFKYKSTFKFFELRNLNVNRYIFINSY